MPDLADRRLYLCTPDRPDLEEFIQACVDGGVDIVQLRDKQLAAKPLVRRARAAVEACHRRGVVFILNDRPDLALDVGADGVHVGQDDASPALARRILGPEAIVGLSTHSSSDLRASKGEPVDYISAGPVVPTPTKPGRAGTGTAYVREVARSSAVPFFVTGGVAPGNVGELVRAGAKRFVVVRYLTQSSDPRRDALALSAAIDEAIARDG